MFSLGQCDNIVTMALKNKNPPAPRLYIKYGPPGSGKGTIMNHVSEHDNINKDALISIDIDSIIESNNDYMNKIKHIMSPVVKT